MRLLVYGSGKRLLHAALFEDSVDLGGEAEPIAEAHGNADVVAEAAGAMLDLLVAEVREGSP